MRGGHREGAGRKCIKEKKISKNIYLPPPLEQRLSELSIIDCKSFNKKCVYLLEKGLEFIENERKALNMTEKLKFIDLFAGIGGIRKGFEDENTIGVFSSEWDKFAQKTYEANYGEVPAGDIT